MKKELRTPTEKKLECIKARDLSIGLSFTAVAAGLMLAVLSYLRLIP